MKKILFLFAILVVLVLSFASCGNAEGKAELSAEMISCQALDLIYVYTGREVTFRQEDFVVWAGETYVDIDLFEFEYKDNVEAGTASVTVTAKPENPYVTGSVTLHFTITPSEDMHCENDDDLAALLASKNIDGVQVWSDITIPEGTTITVPEGKTLSLIYGYCLTNYGTIVNNGTVVMRGALLSTGGRRASELVNFGSFVNHGEMEIKDYVTIEDHGAFTSDVDIVNRGTVYLKDEDKLFLKDADGGVHYVRHQITASDISVADCVYKQGTTEYKPEVTIAEWRAEYTTEYADNAHAGQGSVSVTMALRDRYYYGEVTVPFTIKKGVATANSLAELRELLLSDDYEQYYTVGLMISEEENFTWPSGKSLRVGGTIVVKGSFTLEGDVTCLQFSVHPGGTAVNNTTLYVEGRSFSVSGTFTNGENGDWVCNPETCQGIQLSSGSTFINKGNVGEKNFLLSYGTIQNEGNISVTTTYMGKVVNRGEATFYGMLASDVFNESQGKLTVTEIGLFSGKFVNDGTFINQGTLSFTEDVDYSCNGTFDNVEGEVFAFSPLDGISDRLHLRRLLTNEQVDFQVEYLETPYDGTDKKPTFTVDGLPLDPSVYTVKYRYKGATRDTTECVDAGEITATVSIMSYVGSFSLYGGTRSFTYRITPLTIHVTTGSEFENAVKSVNYDRIIFDADISYSSSYYNGVTIRKDCTIDLNGHKWSINAKVLLKGTVIGTAVIDPVDFTPSQDAASIVVWGALTNCGRIENDGFIYVTSAGSFLGNARETNDDPAGVVVNNGVILTSAACAQTDDSTGTVYVRENINDLSSCFDVPYMLYYNGEDQTPVVTMTHNGAPVDMSRFTVVVFGGLYAGTGTVEISVKDPLDTAYYGKAKLWFTIMRGTAEVNNAASFAAAAADANYEKIRLTANVTLTTPVTLSKDQTLDLASYELFFSGNGALTYGTNCRLILTADNEERFVKYFYVADEIRLSGDIGVAGTRTNLNFKDYRVTGYNGANYLSTVVYTYGHSFIGGLNIVNSSIENFSCTFENPPLESPSAIGSGVDGNEDGYALVYGTCYEETFVTLRNLTVYGVYHHGGSGTAQTVDLSAENCTFLASHDKKDAYAFKIWTSMTANGTFKNCVFDGANGFYVNLGYEYGQGQTLPSYIFYDCVFRAYGECAKQSYYDDYYGNAFTMDRNDKNLCLDTYRCSFYSQNGHCIRVVNKNYVYYTLTDATYEHPEGKFNVY